MNLETYISLTHQELRSYKKIGDEFYCEEHFIVKHKSSYSCESAIYFNLTTDIISNNCNFDFYYNETDVTPTVLDGGDEILLTNWPNDKHMYVILIMIFQLRFQAILMFWLIEAFYVIAE